MAETKITHLARWNFRIVKAKNNGSNYVFDIPNPFIPVAELYRPYHPNLTLPDDMLIKIYFANNALDFVPAVAGHNVDFAELVNPSTVINKRLFDENNPGSNIQEGDCLLILTDQ